MTQFQTIFALAAVTLIGGAAWGIWQYQRVRRAQERNDDDTLVGTSD